MMKRLVAFLVIHVIANTATAGYWGFEREFAERPDVPYEEIVQRIYERWQVEPTHPYFELFEDFRERAKAIFEPETVEIKFRVKHVGANEEKLAASGTMYFSKGDFYLRYDEGPKHEKGDVRSHQYATIDGKLYQWRPGEQEGKILTRFPGDTAELIDYLVDPSLIMQSTYINYWQNAERFSMSVKDEQKLLTYKQPRYSIILGIRVSKRPLWFRARHMRSPSTPEGNTRIYEVDPPKPVDRIPERFRTLPEGISFEQSEDTVDSVLTYL